MMKTAMGSTAEKAARTGKMLALAVSVIGLIAACAPAAPSAAPAADKAAAPMPGKADGVRLTASGQPASLAPAGEMGQAASVMRVTDLTADGVKLFITVGGDPAINGLYTYLAAYDEEERDWRTWMVGDFNEVEVVSDTATEIGLKASKSHIDQPTGDVKTETVYFLVTPPGPQDKTLRVTPATAAP